MIQNINFERKFSRNFYKNLKLPLAEMIFTNRPLKTNRGDIYPVIISEGRYSEDLVNNKYYFKPQGSAYTTHLIGRVNPYSSYEIAIDKLCDGAKAGIYISHKDNLFIYAKRVGSSAEIYYKLEENDVKIGSCDYCDDSAFIFTLHAGSFIETYVKIDDVITHIADAKVEALECLIEEDVFSSTNAALYVESSGECSVNSLLNYLDSGVMQADIKPVKYENGEVLIDNGKIYFTYSSRFETACMQQIVSYKLSSCELELVGALLFDSGDGKWCQDVASSLMYDRDASLWRLWVCVFSHGHRFAYAESKNDLRFGINVVDVKPVDWVENHLDFGGIQGDEDPDFIHNDKDNKWYLSICRYDPDCTKYRYYLFCSDRADGGYQYVSRTDDSVETTGGSFVRFNGEIYFCFGRAFGEIAKYDVCAFPSMKKLGELQCNYNDGGFRGWGSVFEIPCGTRKRLLWATFDRTLGSSYNWSYGNLYFYESKTMKV